MHYLQRQPQLKVSCHNNSSYRTCPGRPGGAHPGAPGGGAPSSPWSRACGARTPAASSATTSSLPSLPTKLQIPKTKSKSNSQFQTQSQSQFLKSKSKSKRDEEEEQYRRKEVENKGKSKPYISREEENGKGTVQFRTRSLSLSLFLSPPSPSISNQGELPQCGPVQSPNVCTVFGIIGMLKLLVGSYLLVITGRECVGSYLGHPIFRVSTLRILPCNHSLSNSPVEQKKMEAEFSVLLNAAERTSGLFFSYDVNLTLCMRRLHDMSNETKLLPLWRQAEPRFLWNNYMLEPLIDSNLNQYLLPIIQGSYQHFQAAIGTNILDVTLIARRCTRRTGTRMWRRGADRDGYVANFVETEQILQANGLTASFVQVRGSIPLLWEQIVDLSYKPSFDLVKPEEAPRVAERHFLDLRKKYGSVLAVDLINKHGSEGHLSERFANAMQPIVSEDIRYVQFDFHRICGHIHFERLSLLYDQIEDYLKKHGYFLLNEKGEKVEEHTGVVRTNCIDCLDRTNVTQSMIGRKMLESQLKRIGVFGSDDAITAYPFFDASFKILWANHGDDISIQYSGTPALKGDFVRYGKRTVQGIIKDGWNALARYYLNNFVDGTKQDAIDLLQGHYIVSLSRDMAPTTKAAGLETYASFRLAFTLVLAGLMFAVMSLRQARNDVLHLLLSLFWAGLSLGVAAFVRANGRMFTNRPRLFRSRH